MMSDNSSFYSLKKNTGKMNSFLNPAMERPEKPTITAHEKIH